LFLEKKPIKLCEFASVGNAVSKHQKARGFLFKFVAKHTNTRLAQTSLVTLFALSERSDEIGDDVYIKEFAGE